MALTHCARRCGKSWRGMKLEHCMECHDTFTGSGSGDKHRTGTHGVLSGPDRRRCRTIPEMLAIGMAQNAFGHWMSSARKEGEESPESQEDECIPIPTSEGSSS